MQIIIIYIDLLFPAFIVKEDWRDFISLATTKDLSMKILECLRFIKGGISFSEIKEMSCKEIKNFIEDSYKIAEKLNKAKDK